MKIITRYIFREFLLPLVYCLVGFVSIYILFELFGSFSRLLSAKLPLALTVEYFVAYLAPFFHYLAPAALMLATLYTMWNFCRHSELIAMRANGISYATIVRPILIVAALMSVFVWWVGDVYVPHHAPWAQRLKSERFNLERTRAAGDIIFPAPRYHRTWSIARLADDFGEHFENVRVTMDRPAGGRLFTVVAPRADYLDGEWWFTDAVVQHYDRDGREVVSPTPELDALTLRTFPEFRERPSDFLALNRKWDFNSIHDRLRYLRGHRDLPEDLRRSRTYSLWQKILAPLACLIITLLSIPAGIASGRQSVFRGILGALGMFFAFYGLDIGCMVAANLGYFPPVAAAFAPHVLFLLLGLRAFHRLN